MKKIRIFMLHPLCKDVDTMLDYLQLKDLKKKFDFQWDSRTPDYLIASEHLYTNRSVNIQFKQLATTSVITIFHGGEAVSPDFNIFDYAVGFDGGLKYLDRFCLLPPPNVFFENFLSKAGNDINTPEEARKELKNKKGFCNFLYSNGNAHPRRDELFFALSKYKKVDSLGRWLNNVQQKGTGYQGHAADCISIKNPYKFSIACENARYYGYTSEKLLTSLEAHTVPIYWGDPLIEESINPHAFINCNRYERIEDVINRVKEIDEDDELWCKMIAQPWQLNHQIEKWTERRQNYNLFFENIFNQEKNEAFRRPFGTMNGHYHEMFWDASYPKRLALIDIVNRAIKKIKGMTFFIKIIKLEHK